jgi:phospholipid transport system transporter-binding protein
MLLGWTRAAQRNKRELYVKGLPGDLLSLAKLYGVADLLPQSSN